jgi:hypothetical protein
MTPRMHLPLVFSLGLLGCGSATPVVAAPDASTPASDGAVLDAPTVDAPAVDAPTGDVDFARGVRGRRYCEVLAGAISGPSVQLDVYNTYGLNECPDAAWRALDVAALRTELGVPVVVLNGPRYWTIDAFESAAVQDPTVRSLGGIPMRVAGRIEVPLAVAAAGSAPYTERTVRRDSTVRFAGGGRVYELIDPMDRVYVMQSYTVQREAQTEASLSELGARLQLPSGWRFRTRVLTEDLRVVAEGGLATVSTDDVGNTYQRSQQRP